jgi:hypothetical protein
VFEQDRGTGDLSMEEGDTTSQDPADADAEADDATVAIWGTQRSHGTSGRGDAPSADIWGSAPAEKVESEEPDPVDPPPDLWGGGSTPRQSRERAEGDDLPARFTLPPAWVATPKRKPGWLLRRRRR